MESTVPPKILHCTRGIPTDSASSAPAAGEPLARRDGLASASSASAQRSNQRASDTAAQSQSGNANAGAPPAWLAEAIADPQRGKEARAFWESAQSAERDSAAYRATFATPEAARDAAARAGQLNSIDRAYYGTEGVAPHELSASREALAQQLLRDDPAAFRDVLAAGLRAAGVRNIEGILPGTISSQANSSRNAAHTDHSSSSALVTGGQATQQAQLAAYAAFERATNDDVDRAVGPEIDRVLEQALPASNSSASGRATHERLAGMVHNEIGLALKQDRALGEQITQLLRGGSARDAQAGSPHALRFDDETRAQVVRLIAARAASLVPSASRRVLGEWTQSALSARRERSSRGASHATSGIDAAPTRAQSSQRSASTERAARQSRNDAAHASTTPQRESASPGSRDSSRRGINYRALTDEDILGL